MGRAATGRYRSMSADMNKPDHTEMVRRARSLRSDLTPAEYELWHHLRQRQLGGFKFTRQFVIGRHIVDFCCRSEYLVIELDGGHHSEQAERDASRSAALEAANYRVLRFWNNDVMENVEGVLERIRETLVAGRGSV